MVSEIWTVTDRIFCHFGPFFPLLPPNNPKNQNLEKMKQTPGDIIISQQVPKIMIICYTVSQIWHVPNLIIFYFGLFFTLLPPQQPQNSKFRKNFKKALEISSLYNSAPKIMIICYTVPKIQCVTDVIVIFHFGLFLALLLPYQPKKSIKKKMKKTPRNITILHMCNKNYDQMMFSS